jgi:hypothetical protein
MISDLDDTIGQLLNQRASRGSELAAADIDFAIPDAEWRSGLDTLTVNCYLYDVRENTELRTNEPLVQRSADGERATRRRPPVRIDCAYCITTWSRSSQASITDEHRLLGQVLVVLLKHPTIPSELLQGSLANQIAPYPTVIASPDGVKNPPQFWEALGQQLKPSSNYVVTLALMLDEAPDELGATVKTFDIEADHRQEAPDWEPSDDPFRADETSVRGGE